MTNKKFFQEWLSLSQSEKIDRLIYRFKGISYKEALKAISALDKQANDVVYRYKPQRRTLARRNRA